MSIFVGGDPELMIVTRDRKREALPAHLFFESRDELQKKDRYHNPPVIFRDGFALEFNPQQSHCRDVLARNYIHLVHRASATLKPQGAALLASSAISVSNDGADWPPDVRRAGCSQSLNAYQEMPPPPKDLTKLPFRAAGGHYHISWEQKNNSSYNYVDGRYVWQRRASEPEKVPIDQIVRMADAFVGIPFTYIFQDRPEIFIRRTIYGRAGEYRKKHDTYFEYRVLGAEAWGRIPFVSLFAGLLRQVVIHREKLAQKWDPSWEPYIREAIDTGVGLADVAKGISVPAFLNLDVMERVRKYAKYCALRFPFVTLGSEFYGFASLSSSLKGMPPHPDWRSGWKLFGKVAA